MSSPLPLDPKTYRIELLRTAATLSKDLYYCEKDFAVKDAVKHAKALLKACGIVEYEEEPEEDIFVKPKCSHGNEFCLVKGCVNEIPFNDKPATCQPESTLSDIAKHYYGKHSFLKQDLPATCQHVMGEEGEGSTRWYCGSPLPCPKHPSV